MLRLVLLVCLAHLSVGAIISGRVVLDDNSDAPTSFPSGYDLVIEVLDTSRADGPARPLGRVQYSNVVSFPISYEVTYTPNVSPPSSYTLSAKITYKYRLRYFNDHLVRVTPGAASSIDISVRATSSSDTR